MKKKLIITSILMAGVLGFSLFTPKLTAEAAENVIYIAPDGKDNAAGTSEDPKALSIVLFNNLKPGETVLMKEGTYHSTSRFNVSESGKPDAYITLRPETETTRVVVDFTGMEFNSANRGFQVTADYYHFYGFEVTGAGDNGMYIAGNNNIVENCMFYKNMDSGLQLGRGFSSDTSINQWPSNNLIKNCTSFYNYDADTMGENADGFAAKLTVGYGNVFDGCIAYRNSDDGWDLYAKQDSGCIGTVIIKNCLSFENGFLPIARTAPDGVTVTYDTTNGDGIGFKLGGGVMEGDVIVENCIAFNNKFHGFSDNSNPGFIRMKNCTAVNNGINVNADGTVGGRGIPGVKTNYNNFDLARSTDSYNSYYGLLSFVNNQENFVATPSDEIDYNEDMFRGSVAYSIFQTSYDTKNKCEEYVSNGAYKDLSVYKNDNIPQLTTPHKQLTSAIFKELKSYNAVGDVDVISKFHKELRNADGSINLGDNLKIVDEELLTFADGSSIGADLAKSSYDAYDHYNLGDVSKAKSEDEALLISAQAVLEVATNVNAVYQHFELPIVLIGCEVKWQSSNEKVVKIADREKASASSTVYGDAIVYDPLEDTDVTLTATIYRGDLKLTKEFVLHVKSRSATLGSVINEDEKDTYIVGRYQTFKKPNIIVTDGSSYDNSELDPALYDLNVKYEWAENQGDEFIQIKDIFTSVPGVFRVTTTATLKADSSIVRSYTYYLYVGHDECEIDFAGGIHDIKINSEGFNISGTLTNIFGKLHVVVVDKNVTLYEPAEVLAHKDVQTYIISTNKIKANFIADNSSPDGYKIYYVVSDRKESEATLSQLYQQTIDTAEINTKDEFYNLAQGIGSYGRYTIYNLTTDLDFTDYNWVESETPNAFNGVFNGNNHKISNLNVVAETQKQANIFYKLENGTIMNVDFEEISIVNNKLDAKLIGIVGAMNGGYISNITMNNITVMGKGASSTCAGALVGQMIGGINTIDHITLDNDSEHVIRVGSKYAGGIVGNIQMDSSSVEVEAYISYCIVRADLGDGKDSGGCYGGIVGRVKNESKKYVLDINNCYYSGTITVKGNYNAGILGSVEAGNGAYTVNQCFADVIFIYMHSGKEVFDAKKIAEALEEDPAMDYSEIAHKNCNPICGRGTTLDSLLKGDNNAGSWAENYNKVIKSLSIYFSFGPDFKISKSFCRTYLYWDMENDWDIDETGKVILR